MTRLLVNVFTDEIETDIRKEDTGYVEVFIEHGTNQLRIRDGDITLITSTSTQEQALKAWTAVWRTLYLKTPYEEWLATKREIKNFEYSDGTEPGHVYCYGQGANVISIWDDPAVSHKYTLEWMGDYFSDNDLPALERKLYELATQEGCL